jgi:hypothetical protein
MPVSRRRKRKEPRDAKKEPRDLKKDLVRATTISSVALLPILGAFGFRASAEPTAQEPTSANIIEYGNSSDHPELSLNIIEVGDGQVTFEDLLKAQRLHQTLFVTGQHGSSSGSLEADGEVPSLSAGLRAVNSQSEYALNFISESHAENHSASKAAAIIQAIPGLGGITVDAALAILMMLLAQYGQKVLENLMDDSAESTAKALEKSVSKGVNTLKQKFDRIIANPPSVESDQKLVAEGFDHTFSPEAFAEINKVKQELSRRSLAEPSPSERSRLFGSKSSSRSTLLSSRSNVPSSESDSSYPSSSYASWNATVYSALLDNVDTPQSPTKDDEDYSPQDDIAAHVLRVAAKVYEDYSPKPDIGVGVFPQAAAKDDEESSPQDDPAALLRAAKAVEDSEFSKSPRSQRLVNYWPSESSSALSRSSAPMDFATVEAFRNAAKDAYEAFLSNLDPEDAEILANYLRYRVADEALNAFSSSIHILALQRIVDASILSIL